MKEGSKFKSFRELRKARGGPPSEGDAQRSTDRGWTLETDDGARSAPTADGDGSSPRARILARPAGFGPMEHGPPAYRDVDSDEMGLLASFRVRTVFPADVRAEVADLPPDPTPADLEGRLDLREQMVVTIDGEDAQDFDDAISIERDADGTLLVGVHIADVGHYVRPGTALDAEALARGTSVYLADQVIPMLPEELSNGLCSLVPRRDRLAYTVLMRFDETGPGLHPDAVLPRHQHRGVRRRRWPQHQPQ